ncbi:twin-arginine translocation pathway signal protein [Pseudomonas sp. NPDC090202]|uniref:twin-arginine translocation pathway signal protein n=1 Tax=unclassified Pseudomonas TaxID=196821 RepID=UPI00382BC8E3
MSAALDSGGLSRRDTLKLGLGATLFLSTASLVGCTGSTAASGFEVLRGGDLPFLRALIPVVLDGALSDITPAAAIDGTLRSLDHSLARLSPEMLKLTRQLFDVLTLAITRGPLTGVWGAWEQATTTQIGGFLQRWEHSSLNLLRQGHASLLQLVLMAWYGRAEAWAQCGYPGPPKI